MIEENSPFGWLIFFGLMAFIAWFSFGMDKNRYKDPDPRIRERRQDPSLQWRMTNLLKCPKCDSKNIKFDTMQLMNPPVMVTCTDCDHEWIYTPGYI